MELLKEIDERRARRGLSAEAVPRDVVARILKAATYAPSCFNNQPWRIIAVENTPDSPAADGLRTALTPGNAWALRAAWFFVLATGPHLDCRLDEGRDYALFDLGQAAMALQLQAQHEGLIAHPMAGFSPKKTREAVKLPPELVPVVVLALGRAGSMEALNEAQKASETGPRVRKPLGEVAFLGDYGVPFEQ